MGARYAKDLIELIANQYLLNESLRAENDRLREINLDLGRYTLVLLNGLVTEINDPGVIEEEVILHAARDMADQVARMEEHTA